MGKRISFGLKYKDIISYFRPICVICVIAFGIIVVAASGGGGGDDDSDPGETADATSDTNTDTTDLYDNDDAVYTIDSLAAKLEETADTEAEKSLAIWLWITNNIAYDVDSYLSGQSGENSAEAVLENRKSTCGGYANLFYALAEAMDLEAMVIIGYAKGDGYEEGDEFDIWDMNHAWNAVKIDGDWQLLDATWGAGAINSSQEFVEDYDESWYMPDPEHFIFSHLPVDNQWQLLDTPITKSRFEQLPDLKPVFFLWGFTPQDVYDAIDSGTYCGIVKQYGLSQERSEVEIVDAPIDLYLDAGTEYTFIIRIPDSLAVGLNGTDTWYWCHEYNDNGDLPPYGDVGNFTGIDSGIRSGNGTYTFSVIPEEGELKLMDMYLIDGNTGKFQTLLKYIVE